MRPRFSSTRSASLPARAARRLILSPDDYLRAAKALEVPVEIADLTKDARSSSNLGAPSYDSRPSGENIGWETISALPAIPMRRVPNDPRPLDSPRQRSAHRVALARRHRTPCSFSRCWWWCSSPSPSTRAARSPADRGRRALRGHHVCLGQRAQPGMGARNPPPGAWTRSAWLPTPGAELFLAKVIANFLFVTIVQIDARAVLFRLLQPAHRGQGMAAAAGAAAGHVGAGGQRNVLCRALDAQPQPRTAAVR